MKVAQQGERGFVGPKVESSNLFFHPPRRLGGGGSKETGLLRLLL